MRIYINEHGAKVGISNGKLVVSKNGVKLKSLPAELAESLLVSSSVQITSQALVFLSSRNTSVSWISDQGKIVCSLLNNDECLSARRKKQYALSESRRFCNAFAKKIVYAKIRSQILLLSSLNENCYFPEVEKTISMLSSAENKCSSGSNAAIRGIEGGTSRMYFSALSFFIDKKFGFSGRNRRPPRDCANAALSYSYSVLYNSVDVILRNHGFDTFVGFMHTSQSGHRALASDMMEIFRPLISDRAVLDFLSSANIETDFTYNGEAVYLSDKGRKKLISCFEKAISSAASAPDGYEQSCRGLMLYHADMLSSAVDNKDVSRFDPYIEGESNARSGDI